MTREEFLSQLEIGLSGVAPEEKDNAMQYYREYLDDAGFENEMTVLQELGDPSKLAADIKAVSEAGECVSDTNSRPKITNTDSAYSDHQHEPKPAREFPGGYVPPHPGSHPYSQVYETYRKNANAPTNGLAKALFIILLVLLSPVILGVAVVFIVVLLIPFILAIGFAFSAVVSAIMSFYVMAGSLANALLIFGTSILFVSLTLLSFFAGVKFFGIIPAVIRFCSSLYYRFTGYERGTV